MFKPLGEFIELTAVPLEFFGTVIATVKASQRKLLARRLTRYQLIPCALDIIAKH